MNKFDLNDYEEGTQLTVTYRGTVRNLPGISDRYHVLEFEGGYADKGDYLNPDTVRSASDVTVIEPEYIPGEYYMSKTGVVYRRCEKPSMYHAWQAWDGSIVQHDVPARPLRLGRWEK